MKNKDVRKALKKINDDLIELYAEIFADSVMNSRQSAMRINLKYAINEAIIDLQDAEDEIAKLTT